MKLLILLGFFAAAALAAPSAYQDGEDQQQQGRRKLQSLILKIVNDNGENHSHHYDQTRANDLENMLVLNQEDSRNNRIPNDYNDFSQRLYTLDENRLGNHLVTISDLNGFTDSDNLVRVNNQLRDLDNLNLNNLDSMSNINSYSDYNQMGNSEVNQMVHNLDWKWKMKNNLDYVNDVNRYPNSNSQAKPKVRDLDKRLKKNNNLDYVNDVNRYSVSDNQFNNRVRDPTMNNRNNNFINNNMNRLSSNEYQNIQLDSLAKQLNLLAAKYQGRGAVKVVYVPPSRALNRLGNIHPLGALNLAYVPSKVDNNNLIGMTQNNPYNSQSPQVISGFHLSAGNLFRGNLRQDQDDERDDDSDDDNQ